MNFEIIYIVNIIVHTSFYNNQKSRLERGDSLMTRTDKQYHRRAVNVLSI